jgi:hypothetical protein
MLLHWCAEPDPLLLLRKRNYKTRGEGERKRKTKWELRHQLDKFRHRATLNGKKEAAEQTDRHAIKRSIKALAFLLSGSGSGQTVDSNVG